MIFKFVVLSIKGKFPSLPLLNSCRWTKNKFYVCIYFFLAAVDLCPAGEGGARGCSKARSIGHLEMLRCIFQGNMLCAPK